MYIYIYMCIFIMYIDIYIRMYSHTLHTCVTQMAQARAHRSLHPRWPSSRVRSPTWIVRVHVAVAVCCSELQWAAVCSLSNLDCTRACCCCSVLQFVAVSCSVFALQLGLYAWMLVVQCVAVCCSVLQCVVVGYSVLRQRVAVCSLSNLDCTLTRCCCSVVQCAAVCCSGLQRVVVCCNVFALYLK